jgi:hypothetical protein
MIDAGTDLTWILRPESASVGPSGTLTGAWGLGVNGRGRFYIYRSKPDREQVVTSHDTLSEALAVLPRPIATYLQDHGQSMVLWSLEVAAARSERASPGMRSGGGTPSVGPSHAIR